MSSWSTLVGNNADNLIWEEEYKALFGYPNGKYDSTLDVEVPGTSRFNIFQNQIFADTIPLTVPIMTPIPSGWTSIPVLGSPPASINCGTKYTLTSTYPNICYYDLSLSCISNASGSYPPNNNNLTTGGRTYYTTAAYTYGNDSVNVVNNNFLNKSIPGNYDPAGSYFITVYIQNSPFVFGNNAFPWTLNTNSGILMFTGDNVGTDINSGNNSLPDTSWAVSITFWAYTGGFGGASVWSVDMSNSIIQPISIYSAYTITGSNFNAISDYRIKKEIHDLDSSLHNVDNLRPVIYKQVSNNNVNIGLIAHELQEYYPFLVNGEKNGSITQSVNYIGLIGVLVKEIQDLKKRVNTLEEEKDEIKEKEKEAK